MIIRAINFLNPVTRSVVNMYIFDGYKHEEISEMLNIPMGTSKWHLHQGRKELKVILGKLRSTE
jgi:RNA polymerase sigma-70 factor (ECF subfamily)